MNIWKFIYSKLVENKKLILIIVVDSKGSSAGKQGFKIAVCSDGTLHGSIGGGVLEYKFVGKAKELMKENKTNHLFFRQIHRIDVENQKSGMICSGENSLVLVPLCKKEKNIIQSIINCLEKNKKGVMTISENKLIFEIDKIIPTEYYYKIDKNQIYKELIGYKNIAHIVGAGHVGLALSQTLKQIGFSVFIYDNRQNLNTYENNIFVDKKQVIDYPNIENYVSEGQNIYVIIMTFSHKSDALVVKKLLRKNVKYIGMLGSRKKIETIKNNLKKIGFSENELNKLHAPIGIKINSRTSNEIAVSIAAEIIKIKNEISDCQ